ncbi:MAG: D-alanyl-lipoteichoic acid biosynthesis protein DltD [Pseudanabaena sp.]
MEITSSLDANPLLTSSPDSSADAGTDTNQPTHLPNHRFSASTSEPTLVQESSPSILTEELAGIKLSHTKQKGDCLYLYSQDREVTCATKLLEAIAPSTQDLESSVLFAEGIHRLKLHGNAWALGLDLPIAPSAIIAAEIIAALLTNFRQDPQLAPKLAQTKLKLLLQNNCLNLLCETRKAILQAEIALPMLNTLRTVSASEYFQSVTVSSRVIGEKKPIWSFEIDLLAIGLQNPDNDELSTIENEQESSIDFAIEDEAQANAWHKLSGYARTKIIEVGQAIFSLKWLGQTEPKMLSLSACLASLAIGIGTTVAVDRSLSHYAQSDQSTRFVIADSKIDVSVSQPETSTEKGLSNKPAPNFNIALFNEKLALLDWQTTNKQQSPEVLIVGSSRALRGIEPKTLEKALINKGYKNINVFNLGIDGATAKVVQLQITQILSPAQLPRLIIWADGLRAFNSSRNDLTYEEITASVGYKQLQETRKDKNRNVDTIANSQSAIATASPSPISKSFDFLFTTFSKRQEIRTSLVKKFDQNTHMLSNSEALIAATMPSTVTALDPKGFVAFDVTFDPNTYFQKFPQVPGDYDLDYRNFETNGSQFEAFVNVVDFCRRNNIELLVVNMPLHATYLDQIRTQYEATFNRRMQELSLREGFIYLDLSQAILNQADLFSDPSHLNKKGAIAISQLLTQNPKVRWQVLKK